MKKTKAEEMQNKIKNLTIKNLAVEHIPIQNSKKLPEIKK
jgi:hypothetical protein